ncbi:GNAT family N-acetyltransferase [Paracoccus sp. YIM 132242]|uniref:L-ornithine N(alpha)-acyltransferase n=1 Tax=Paracoccus lichenicola TaxID=2665644 RepID=A0A6L6HS78_9RHOB|nr:GNAT family N-acetyltransferase [Paracoccus lichenicola]MTE00148.1 GNAT family N-acetyltransferase [Paracoccus lichenicola]
MQPLRKGRYLARLAGTSDDLRAAQRLRWLCFVARNGAADDGAQLEADALDARCHHMLVEDAATGQLACCFRFLPLADGRGIARSYSAQFYDLSALESFDGPMLEIGRFCVHPALRDPDIIRIAWAALTRLVEDTGVQMLFGCSSFIGTEPAAHAEAFAVLRARHLAPRRWWPRIKAPHVFRFARALLPGQPDPKRAMAAMPPLLRSYLALGGWVSDHAVVDPLMRTMHVFTGVEIRAIPPARRRLLQAAAS